jgi:hypothetical protein
MSSDEWCNAHPMPGRENVESGTAEWWAMPNADVSDGCRKRPLADTENL